VIVPTSAEGNDDVWHLYVVRVPDRDRVLSAMQSAGIGVGIRYPTPIHLTAAFAGLNHDRGSFPVSEDAARSILSLPMYPHITPKAQDYVAGVLMSALC